jgi:D-alanyl-lipoteichoic acid acyltransferase DltB (MBOAT superfamily)
MNGFNWFLTNVGASPVAFDIPAFFAVLPVGISFYTFQSMSYTIDVCRGQLSPTRNVLLFFSYISLFPQLVAGPIVRARDFIPQLKSLRKTTEIERWDGLKLILTGYFKKVVLADNIAPMVNNAFGNDLSNTSWTYWWIVMTGFAFQIYCDFSGYSDIARGLAKWMGFHFRINFNHPYLSASFREFWTRWHISLSTWFRDYVYIPLGGNRGPSWRRHLNLWITMLLSGLWHGAGLNFLCWGASHAFFMSAERVVPFTKFLNRTMIGKCVSVVIVFLLVTLAWTFFRAGSLGEAMTILGHMVSIDGSVALSQIELPDLFYTGMMFLGIGILIELMVATGMSVNQMPGGRYLEVVQYATVLAICIFFRGTGEQFIYFQF